MTPAGAKALARHLTDLDANPPVRAVVGSNGSHHESVVHVTFGEPKAVEKRDKDGNVTAVTTPERPRPYTVA